MTTQRSVFVYNGTTLIRIANMGKINPDCGNMFRHGIFLKNKYGFLTNKGLIIMDENKTTFIPNCVSVLQFQDFIIYFMTADIKTSYPRLCSIRFGYGGEYREYIEVNYIDNAFGHKSVFKTPNEGAFGFVSGRHIRLIPLQ